jgi:hypothetical protein
MADNKQLRRDETAHCSFRAGDATKKRRALPCAMCPTSTNSGKVLTHFSPFITLKLHENIGVNKQSKRDTILN